MFLCGCNVEENTGFQTTDGAEKQPVSPSALVSPIVRPIVSPPEAESSSSPAPSLEDRIVSAALEFEGLSYVYGGESPESGFDCSGLTWYVFREHGYRLGRTAALQAQNGEHIDYEDLRPGDLVCFRGGNGINHCGLYIGDGSFIHAMDSSHGIIISSLDEYLERYTLEARRIVGCVERKSISQIEAEEEYDRMIMEELAAMATPTPSAVPTPEQMEKTPAPGSIVIISTPSPSPPPIEVPDEEPAEDTAEEPSEPVEDSQESQNENETEKESLN